MTVWGKTPGPTILLTVYIGVHYSNNSYKHQKTSTVVLITIGLYLYRSRHSTTEVLTLAAMAGFSVTYRKISDLNIKHIYSGFPTEVRYRSGVSASSFNMSDKLRWERQQRQLRTGHPRDLEYVAEYDAELPKAPALRQLKSREVNRIVARLITPRNSNIGGMDSSRRRTVPRICDEVVRNESAPPSRHVTRQQMDHITERLLRPTYCSRMRNIFWF